MRDEEKRMVRALRAAVGARGAGKIKAVVGLDGFIDEIVHVVSARKDHETYKRLEMMGDYADRIKSFAGKSGNIEYVPQRVKIGGNGPIMGNAIAALGASTTYIGNIGWPEVHPVFKVMEETAELITLAEPCHTDAVEFLDGKIMIGKMAPISQVTWERLMEVVGMTRLQSLLDSADLLALVNWTMITFMSDIYDRLLADVCPKFSPGKERYVFFDLADPQKRETEDIARMLSLVGRFSKYYKVIFGLNGREARQIADVLGVGVPADLPDSVEKTSEAISRSMGIYSVLVHPVEFAVTTIGGNTYRQDGPHTKKPVITTGAGDHFNAAFCLGQTLGMDPRTSLLMGVCNSGYYVMSGRTPSLEDLMGFMENWRDDPFGLMSL